MRVFAKIFRMRYLKLPLKISPNDQVKIWKSSRKALYYVYRMLVTLAVQQLSQIGQSLYCLAFLNTFIHLK